MGATYWRFNGDSCQIEMVGVTPAPPRNANSSISCDCNFENNNTVCHVTRIVLKGYSLPGMLPPQLVKLPHLREVSVLVNRLSGEIPKELGNITTLTYLSLEANQFSGIIPPELGDLINLKTLMLSSNDLTGNLPITFARLRNLTDLRISDIDGPNQDFPMLRSMTDIVTLVLRNCRISGEIPAYIWTMMNMVMLDVSFNKLVGELPPSVNLKSLKFLFLTSNLLSGNVPGSILEEGKGKFLIARRISTVHDSSHGGGFGTAFRMDRMFVHLCFKLQDEMISQDAGYGIDITFESGIDITLESESVEVSVHMLHDVQGCSFDEDVLCWKLSQSHQFELNLAISLCLFWDCSSYLHCYGGEFDSNCLHVNSGGMDVAIKENKTNVVYEGDAEVEGEIQFTNDKTYNGLGKRVFDIYIQEKLVWKDFNIEDDAGIAQKPVIKRISNISVSNNVLEIRFYWADIKGLDLQTGTFTLKQIKAATNNFDSANKIGEGGFGPVYKGQLPDGTVIAVKQLSSKSKQGNREFLNEIGMISCLQHPNLVKLHGCCIEGEQLLLVYEYMENNNLARAIICSIGFDFVSSGYWFFLICQEINQLKLNWPTRLKICIGIARGLAFLHEESRIKIVHRDIKATNVLLDGDLNPKISDFGLARLDEEEKTHISTRVAGTIGYMAPEYALWGYLTYKADVYSFGVVALEVVSGKSNNNYMPSDNCVCLLDQACQLQQAGNLMKLIDESLGSEVNVKEAEIMVKVALLCTNASASLRPTMSEVVSMLEGRTTVPDMIPEPSTYSDDLRFKAMRDLRRQRDSHSLSRSQTQNSTTVHTFCSSTTSGHDIFEINPESIPAKSDERSS
uniref:non-specific serine/threonine protein kinase n=1 Tax=Fagus sylvatica TaxID=28930 RepID=A0A2N9I9A7_FAGSY